MTEVSFIKFLLKKDETLTTPIERRPMKEIVFSYQVKIVADVKQVEDRWCASVGVVIDPYDENHLSIFYFDSPPSKNDILGKIRGLINGDPGTAE